ncbi:hypothetical protein L1887_30579 [Cichorium endivia]|nr:hypothetical protein L1887_30579 [Cichorium endivia]
MRLSFDVYPESMEKPVTMTPLFLYEIKLLTGIMLENDNIRSGKENQNRVYYSFSQITFTPKERQRERGQNSVAD